MLPLARNPPTVLRRVSLEPGAAEPLVQQIGVFRLDDGEHELHGASHRGIRFVTCGFPREIGSWSA